MSFTVFATGLIVGAGLGAGLVHFSYQRRFLQQQQNFSKGMRRTIEELEKAHESRLQETAHSLRADYERQQRAATPLPPAVAPNSSLTAQPEPIVDQSAAPPAAATLTKTSSLQEQVSPPAAVQKKTIPAVAGPLSNQPEGLVQKLMAWGQTGQLANIAPLLRYANHRDRQVRAAVAAAIGQIASTNRQSGAMQKTIPALDKLSRDVAMPVRQAAVEAIGNIQSSQAIPLLERAARDPAGKVAKLASDRLRQYKFYRTVQPNKPRVASKHQTKR